MNNNSKDATRARILKMEAEREERRKAIQQAKQAKKLEQAANIAAGNPGDVDFIGLVRQWRAENARQSRPHQTADSKICVCVRKRPFSDKERERLDHDSVTCVHPHHVWIHSAKFRVDGITKYLTHNSFKLDYAFDESIPTEKVYLHTCMPLVDFMMEGKGGRATVFCYGQTGSGKTYTMNGIQRILCHDLYSQLESSECNIDTSKITITVAFFELYAGFIQDLLNERNRCKLLEDGEGEVNILGLEELPANTPAELLKVVEMGNSLRTTHATEANDTSSRSHAICQVFIRDTSGRRPKLLGKLSLVDLAGSERGSDTKSHNSQRRSESADINTSLLSLKECIRALGQSQSKHVPYRGSKLTLILKDCFTSPSAKTVMVATVSPGASSADHSLNTLRYADRIKEQKTKSSARNARSKQAYPVSKARIARILGSDDGTDGDAYNNQDVDDIDDTFNEDDNDDNDEKDEIDTLDQWLLEDEENNANANANANAMAQTRARHVVNSVPPTSTDRLSETIPLPRTVSGLSNDDSVAFDDPDEDELIDEEPILSKRKQFAPEEEQKDDRFTTALNDQDELRRTVQTLFELEESLLNQHMENIQENAEMLTQEGKLLQKVQNGSLDEAMDAYAVTLAEFLERKTKLINKLQDKLEEFKHQLAKEQELSQRVKSLSQY